MIGPIEVCLELIRIGIFGLNFEWVKEWSLLGLNNGNNEAGKLLTTVDYLEYISDFIREDNYDVNYEGIILGISDDANLA